MKNFLYLLLTALLFSACSDAENEKYNILFIAIDDLKPMLGCYGDTTIITPNIDKLADGGVIFLNNHCQQAVCGPSRASLLTGLYPDQNRTWGFTKIRDSIPDILTLPQHFRNQGYTTVNISKIFDQRTVDKYWDSLSWSRSFPLSEEDLDPYFDPAAGPVTGYFYQSNVVKDIFENVNNKTGLNGHLLIKEGHKIIKPSTECLDLPDNAYKDGVFALKAVEELEMLSKSKTPFFLGVGFERPHLPFTAPKKYWDLYKLSDIRVSEFQNRAENDSEYYYTRSPELTSYTDENGIRIYDKLRDGKRLAKDEQLKLIHGYKAAVSYIDAQIGKIILKLDELKLMDNTVIVVWGDHGWHLGDHSLWGKSTNFEQATRSPLIIKLPNSSRVITNQPTGFIDLFPTLCELANLPVPKHLSGLSLKKILREGSDNKHNYTISQFQRENKMGYAVRDNRYRYVEWIEIGLHVDQDSKLDNIVGTQLFDYYNDPLEKINLANYEEYSFVQKRMSLYLREHINKILRKN